MIDVREAEGVHAQWRGVVHSLAVNRYDLGRYGRILALIREGKSDEEIRAEYPRWDEVCLALCRRIAAGQLGGGESKALNGNKDGMRFREDRRSDRRKMAQKMWRQGASVTEIMAATGLMRRSIQEVVSGLMHGEEE